MEDQRVRADDRELVDQRGAEHAQHLRPITAGAVDTLEHGADEAGPVLVALEAAGEARMAGRDEDEREHAEGGAGGEECKPRVLDVEERRPEQESDDHEQWQRDHPGEPFEHDRPERDRARVDGFGAAGNADDIAADRRRQDVAHELAGEVVAGEGAERHFLFEEAQHQLPPPGREHDPEERGRDREAQQECRAQGMVVGDADAVAVGHLGDQQREEHRAQAESQCNLPAPSGSARERSRLLTSQASLRVQGTPPG